MKQMKAFISLMMCCCLMGCHPVSNSIVDYKQLHKNIHQYRINNTAFKNDIDFQISSDHFSKLHNQKLAFYQGSVVTIHSITPVDDNWVIYLDFKGSLADDTFILLSPEVIKNGESFMNATVMIDTSLTQANQRTCWDSYDIIADGIRVSYRLFNSDKDKDKAKGEAFELNFSIEGIVIQTWKKTKTE